MTKPTESQTPVSDKDIKSLDQEIDQVFEEKASEHFYEVACNIAKNFKAVLFQQ